MPRFTTISPTSVPNEKQRAWERFRDGRYVAIGWLNKVNLTDKSISEILDLIRREGYGKYDESDGLRSFPRFLELEPGDFIGVKNVNHGLFGIGIIRSGYKFNRRKHFAGGRKDFFYAHYRDVEWVKTTYTPSASFVFDGEKAWEPRGTIGQVYSELPGYIVRLLGNSVVKQTPKSPGLGQDTLIDDLESIEKSDRDATTKDALVKARIGQGKFRAQVLKLWGYCCAVTGSSTRDAIRASHIKPWRDSTDEERLDSQNGLPLVASLDALFDAGLISFESSGKLIVSSKLTTSERRIFGIGDQSLTNKPSANTAEYLAYHRDNPFQR